MSMWIYTNAERHIGVNVMTRDMFELVYSHANANVAAKLASEFPDAVELGLYGFVLTQLAKRDVNFHITLRQMFPSVLADLCQHDKAMSLVECPRF